MQFDQQQIEKIGDALGGVGRAVAPVVPTLGGGLVLASTLLGAFGSFDKVIGDGSKVVGLSTCADVLENMMTLNNYNEAVIKDVIQNLRDINSAFSTLQKIIN